MSPLFISVHLSPFAIHTLEVHTSLDSCRPVDPGQPAVLAAHPSSALPADCQLLPS